MNVSTVQLLVARWYPGSGISVADARSELARRGWSRSRQLAALAFLLPVIAPDRIMHLADVARGDREESGTPREIGFSALFSISTVSLAAALISLFQVIERHDAGQPYQLRWLLGWFALAVISGYAARTISRFRT